MAAECAPCWDVTEESDVFARFRGGPCEEPDLGQSVQGDLCAVASCVV
jgi:hypothetical protein